MQRRLRPSARHHGSGDKGGWPNLAEAQLALPQQWPVAKTWDTLSTALPELRTALTALVDTGRVGAAATSGTAVAISNLTTANAGSGVTGLVSLYGRQDPPGNLMVLACTGFGVFASCFLVISLWPQPALPGIKEAQAPASPDRNPSAEECEDLKLGGQHSSEDCKSLKSCVQIWALTTINVAYGYMIAGLGLLVAPLEAERLWPGRTSEALGVLTVLTGVAQLVGPEAGYFSDVYRSRFGRRRPMLLISVAFIWTLSFGMWLSSQQLWPIAFTACFFLQQVALNVVQCIQMGLVPDLVPAAQHGFAGGLSAANTLLGAALAFASMDVFNSWDYHCNYAIMSGLSVACGAMVCAAADEQSSLATPALISEASFLEQIVERYTFDVQQHYDFFLLMVTKTLYCTGVSVKAFLLYFCRDTFKIHAQSDEEMLLGRVAAAAELFALLAALCTSQLLDGERKAPVADAADAAAGGVLDEETPARSLLAVWVGSLWLAVMWFSPIVLGIAVQHHSDVSGAQHMQAWIVPMLIGTAVWGIGQGIYLAGDQALAFGLLPDGAEASRYLSFNCLCSCIGCSLGGLICSGLLAFFGSLGQHSTKGYAFPGYVAIFVFSSLATVSITAAAARIHVARGVASGGRSREASVA